jgi:phosphoribosyl 1,2-cyclic phosphate phosphodiesterase
MNYLKNSIVDCVLCDTTFGKNLDGDNHMGVEDNIQLRKIMVEQGSADENTKFILTHLSHNGGLTHEQLEQTAENNGFLAAYDGFELEF